MRGSTPVCSATGKGPVTVLDTGALIAGLQMRLPAACVTTPMAVNEVKDADSRKILEDSLEVGRLTIIEPSRDYVKEASRLASSLGLLSRLSQTDLSLLALAMELRGCGAQASLATDDYALQSVALRANIDVIKVRYRGIRELKRRR